MTQRLFHSVRAIHRCMSPQVSNRNGVDVAIEQVYSPVLPHLGEHHLVQLRQECECLSMRLPWLLTRYADYPQVYVSLPFVYRVTVINPLQLRKDQMDIGLSYSCRHCPRTDSGRFKV